MYRRLLNRDSKQFCFFAIVIFLKCRSHVYSYFSIILMKSSFHSSYFSPNCIVSVQCFFALSAFFCFTLWCLTRIYSFDSEALSIFVSFTLSSGDKPFFYGVVSCELTQVPGGSEQDATFILFGINICWPDRLVILKTKGWVGTISTLRRDTRAWLF